ncbi:VOC family protein [Parasphingorhabdus litoris]|uniref:VOC family protein n=1 Tax=Parasphingorhabdus litoris TaxID=394733 RepID=A0ABN1AV82_9SPHN|nr:VOC family protein [Parasphingorhabdus litoris]
MIDHLEVQTRDVDLLCDFYKTVLEPVGYALKIDDAVKGFGNDERMDFFIVQGEPSSEVHYAFQSSDRKTVDRVYSLAGQKGFTLDREPSLAPHIHPNYYAAYLRDPDGRLVEFVSHNED